MAWSCPVNVRLLFVLRQPISLCRVRTKSPIYFHTITGETCQITGKIQRDNEVCLVVCNFVTSHLKAMVLGMKPLACRYCQWLQDTRNVLDFLFFLYTAFTKISSWVPSGRYPGDFDVSVHWGQTLIPPIPCSPQPHKTKMQQGLALSACLTAVMMPVSTSCLYGTIFWWGHTPKFNSFCSQRDQPLSPKTEWMCQVQAPGIDRDFNHSPVEAIALSLKQSKLIVQDRRNITLTGPMYMLLRDGSWGAETWEGREITGVLYSAIVH